MVVELVAVVAMWLEKMVIVKLVVMMVPWSWSSLPSIAGTLLKQNVGNERSSIIHYFLKKHTKIKFQPNQCISKLLSKYTCKNAQLFNAVYLGEQFYAVRPEEWCKFLKKFCANIVQKTTWTVNWILRKRIGIEIKLHMQRINRLGSQGEGYQPASLSTTFTSQFFTKSETWVTVVNMVAPSMNFLPVQTFNDHCHLILKIIFKTVINNAFGLSFYFICDDNFVIVLFSQHRPSNSRHVSVCKIRRD